MNEERDEEDDARARAWSRQARQRAEAGLDRDDSEFLALQIAEERERLNPGEPLPHKGA